MKKNRLSTRLCCAFLRPGLPVFFLAVLVVFPLCLVCCSFAFAFEEDELAFGPRLSKGATAPLAPSRFDGMNKVQQPKKGVKGSSFDMAGAVRHALTYNPSLGAAEAQAKSSLEGKKSDLAAMGPKLGTTYSFYKQTRSTSVQTNSGLPSRGTYSWSLEVSQILFEGFRTLGTYQRQALQAESDKASLRQSELEITQSVQENFVTYLSAVANVRSQQEAVARLQDQLEITQAFHEVGLRPKLDVLQAQVDLGDAQHSLVQLENTRDTTLARLNTLLGLAATENVAYKGALVTRKFDRSLEQCLETAYKLRPDLYIGYKAVEMAIKDRLIARSGYYPSVEAYYNITKTGNRPDLERAGSHSSRTTTWEVGARLTWDVFQWGTTYFADQEAGWLVAKARRQAQGIVLDAGYDVKEKFLALREALRRIDVAKQNVAHAREAYDAALAQYREQVGTNFDVLDASSNLLTAEVELTSARADYIIALSSLYVAIGEYHPDLL